MLHLKHLMFSAMCEVDAKQANGWGLVLLEVTGLRLDVLHAWLHSTALL